MEVIKNYIALTKPGIVRGNVMTAAAGFLFASQGQIDLRLFVATMAGVALVIASACVCNNYIDREIDKKMDRTRKRALVTGIIPQRQALLYALALEIIGFGLLIVFTNILTVWLGVTAFFFYVVVYGFAKRRTPFGTLVGTVPGALPVTAGYTAVTNQLDGGALLLFLTMVVWQMPHFYAIATYRLKDYKAAGLPVLSVARGIPRTKKSILAYIAAYLVVSSLVFVFDYAGYSYLVVMLAVSAWWLYVALKGFKTVKSEKWAGKVFGISLVVLMAWSIMLSLDAWLP